MVILSPENHVRAVGRKGNQTIEDQINFRYQTQKWAKPAQFQLRSFDRLGDRIVVEAQLTDASGILCLDARNAVRFAVAGDGELIGDLGINTAARVVELYNGRAMISLLHKGGKSHVSVSSKDIPTAFLQVR